VEVEGVAMPVSIAVAASVSTVTGRDASLPAVCAASSFIFDDEVKPSVSLEGSCSVAVDANPDMHVLLLLVTKLLGLFPGTTLVVAGTVCRRGVLSARKRGGNLRGITCGGADKRTGGGVKPGGTGCC